MVDIHLLFWSVGYPKEQLDVTHSEILEMNEGTVIYLYSNLPKVMDTKFSSGPRMPHLTQIKI